MIFLDFRDFLKYLNRGLSGKKAALERNKLFTF